MRLVTSRILLAPTTVLCLTSGLLQATAAPLAQDAPQEKRQIGVDMVGLEAAFSELLSNSVLVGHFTADAGDTGCTVVLPPLGTTGGVAVRGGAPGTREVAALGLTIESSARVDNASAHSAGRSGWA